MIALSYAVVVEGKYDVQKVRAVVSTPVLKTDGFGVFKNRETRSLIRRYAASMGGLYLLCDPDGAGKLIRAHLRSVVPEHTQIIDLYVPRIAGKERRKNAPGKEGVLGVEGMDTELLEALFLRYENHSPISDPISRAELYELGLYGKADSKARRSKVLAKLDLPTDLSAARLKEAVDFLIGRQAFIVLVRS